MVELDPGAMGFASIPVVEFKVKKILVPVDFSSLSRKALQYAMAFAKQFDAEILLFHAVTSRPPPPNLYQAVSAAQNEEVRKRAEKRLSQWRDAVVSQAAVKASVLEGVPYLEILRMAQENYVDLIIIGMHGRDGWLNELLGGTTRRVVRHAPCPVLVVREHAHDFLAQARESDFFTKQGNR